MPSRIPLFTYGRFIISIKIASRFLSAFERVGESDFMSTKFLGNCGASVDSKTTFLDEIPSLIVLKFITRTPIVCESWLSISVEIITFYFIAAIVKCGFPLGSPLRRQDRLSVDAEECDLDLVAALVKFWAPAPIACLSQSGLSIKSERRILYWITVLIKIGLPCSSKLDRQPAPQLSSRVGFPFRSKKRASMRLPHVS
jgi:hypothetical protein